MQHYIKKMYKKGEKTKQKSREKVLETYSMGGGGWGRSVL